MRKIILLLLCTLCVVTNAQNASISKAFSKSDHISFMGISLGEDLNTFKKKLKLINYSVNEYSNESEYWTVINGTYGGISDFNFEIGEYPQNKILYIEGIKKYKNAETALKAFGTLKKFVDKYYIKNNATLYNFKEVKGFYKNLYIKDIVNSVGKLVGHIYITYSKGHGEGDDYDNIYYWLSVKYVDNKNNLDCDKKSDYNIPTWCKINDIDSYGNKISYTKYNITKFAYPLYDSCMLNVFDDYIKITATKNNKLYSIYALEEDRSEILSILFGNTKEEVKNGVFQNYMLLAFSKVDNYDICTTCSASEAVSAYYDSLQKKENNSIEHMSKGELWFCLWEGSANVEKYKKDGSYKRRVKAFVSRWNNFVDSGSNGNSTNWDNLNDAQKAVIHDHDNGR